MLKRILCGRRWQKGLRRLACVGRVDLWALDEVHFQQHGSRCRMWIAPKIRDPICRHAPTRKSISDFGAVRIRDGRLVVSKPEGRFDAKTFWCFLRELRRRAQRGGRRVVDIIDNARYHHAKLHAEWRRLQAPDFGLVFLPPYSPHFNPIERVWKLLRKLWLHNRYFPPLDELIQIVELQFDDLGSAELHALAPLLGQITCSFISDPLFRFLFRVDTHEWFDTLFSIIAP